MLLILQMKNPFLKTNILSSIPFVKKITLRIIGKNVQSRDAYAENSALECIALTAVIIMPSLLLQRPHRNSKTGDHISHLKRRLDLWEKGDINALLVEGRTIQHQLAKSTSNGTKSARTFARLMMEGKVRNAVRLISEENSSGILPLDEDVRDSLLRKHPTSKHHHRLP